jgi:HSP20 family protein
MKELPNKFRSDLKQRLSSATKILSEGWRELLVRSSGALTQFMQSSKSTETERVSETFPQWALLAAESWETAQSIIVRIETPGMRKEDLDVSITQSGLRVRGEKHPAGDHRMRIYSLMERAFGRFERTIPLPRNIDASKAEVSYQDGVITVIIRKTKAVPPTQLPIGE